jgi:hypothetical protein
VQEEATPRLAVVAADEVGSACRAEPDEFGAGLLTSPNGATEGLGLCDAPGDLRSAGGRGQETRAQQGQTERNLTGRLRTEKWEKEKAAELNAAGVSAGSSRQEEPTDPEEPASGVFMQVVHKMKL